MLTVTATQPLLEPPAWAVLERRLFADLDRAVEPFAARYTRDDGSLVFRDRMGGRDGADDFYEAFYNWPLLYALGGGDHLLRMAKRHWEGVTGQLTRMGFLHREYERGYDWFHQGESNLFFYFLCLADPDDGRYRERAIRFAGFYTGEDLEADNYDPRHNIIRAPHNGSLGPRWGVRDGEPSYGWAESMARYGLPFHDVPGVGHYDDLRDPALARRMGQAMHERMGRGDVPGDREVAGLLANAYLATGDQRYRDWSLRYLDGWARRAADNGGLLPDNVGPGGRVGELMGGRWYGGLYGWSWPHGLHSVAAAAAVGATVAVLLTGDTAHLDVVRAQLDHVLRRGRRLTLADSDMCQPEQWAARLADVGAAADARMLMVPYRHADHGWFDYQPLDLALPVALWNASLDPPDRDRLERLRAGSGFDWNAVGRFRDKEDHGHEAPWLRFLAGDNPGYPERMLRQSLGQVHRRLEQIRQDDADLRIVHIHHWQQLNPVLTEALLQLTLGAPQVLYNGGLLLAPLRYFDARRCRPGLPADVAALVRRVEAGRTVVQLVNLSPLEERELVVQAGAFAEHRFDTVGYGLLRSEYPGAVGSYRAPAARAEERGARVGGPHLRVRLPPGRGIELDLAVARFANRPSYAGPFPAG